MAPAAARNEAPQVMVVPLTTALAEASQRALVVQTPAAAASPTFVVAHTGDGSLQSLAAVHVPVAAAAAAVVPMKRITAFMMFE